MNFCNLLKIKWLKLIHNADFDLTHLNNELSLIGNEKIKNEVIDTVILAREKISWVNSKFGCAV